jgi:hypothetical protein
MLPPSRWQEVVIRQAENVEAVAVPVLNIEDVRLGHKGQAVELMVSTAQIGSVVLVASDDVLRNMGPEIDRVRCSPRRL